MDHQELQERRIENDMTKPVPRTSKRYDVPCPSCRSPKDHPCRNGVGLVTVCHQTRIDAYTRAQGRQRISKSPDTRTATVEALVDFFPPNRLVISERAGAEIFDQLISPLVDSKSRKIAKALEISRNPDISVLDRLILMTKALESPDSLDSGGFDDSGDF